MHTGVLVVTVAALLLGSCSRQPNAVTTPVGADNAAASTENCDFKSLANAPSSKPNPISLLLPGALKGASWGVGERAATAAARKLAPRIERREDGLIAWVNENTDFLTYRFSDGKLIAIEERHNNPTKLPPYAGAYMKLMKQEYGNPTIVTNDTGGNCFAQWTTGSSNIKATWRAEEQFVEISAETAASVPPVLSSRGEHAVWDYNLALEDAGDMENSVQKTAKHFHISTDDVDRIIEKGGEQH